MINRIILAGEITHDIKIIKNKGNFIITLNLLTINFNRKIWHRIIIYNKLATLYQNKLKKNQIILIEGRINNRRWLNDKNKYNYITEIIVENLSILDFTKNSILKKKIINYYSLEMIYEKEILINNFYINEVNIKNIEREDGYENEL